MLDFLQTADDVIACTLSGRIGREEIEEMAGRVERAIERHAKTHVFVEVEDLSGLDWKAVGEALPHSLPMLGKLDRFGRIAVVSDDPWVRRLTMVESALLPGIGYEIFHRSKRDRALAWVEGKVERPHEPAFRFIPTDNPNVRAIAADGWITGADLDRAMTEFGPLIESGEGKFDILARVGELHISEYAPLFSSRYLQFKRKGVDRVGRYALVGGPDWLRLLSETLAPLTPIDFCHFPAEDEEMAWRWLGAQPASEAEALEPAAADG